MAERAVLNALINQCNNGRVAACLKEGVKCGVSAGTGATVGFLLGGPIGCAVGSLLGASWAASRAKEPSLITVLQELDPDDRNEVVWELLETLIGVAGITATTNLTGLSKMISNGENLEQIFRILIQILKSKNMLQG